MAEAGARPWREVLLSDREHYRVRPVGGTRLLQADRRQDTAAERSHRRHHEVPFSFKHRHRAASADGLQEGLRGRRRSSVGIVPTLIRTRSVALDSMEWRHTFSNPDTFLRGKQSQSCLGMDGNHYWVRHVSPRAKDKRPTRFGCSSSSIAVALQAQWAFLQQQLLQTDSHPGALVSLEEEVLRTLGSAMGCIEDVLRDCENVVPYILSFAVASIPSVQTQVVALQVFRAVLVAISATCGEAASDEFVADFLLREHRIFSALEQALKGASEELKRKRCSPRGMGPTKSTVVSASSSFYTATKDERSGPTGSMTSGDTVTEGLVELLFVMSVVSHRAAAGILAHPNLIHQVLPLLCDATPRMICHIGSILQKVCAVPGALETVVGMQMDDVVWNVIYSCTQSTLRGCSELDRRPTVTALCLFLRVAVQLTGSRVTFSSLYGNGTHGRMLAQLLTVEWGEVVELGCIWVAALLQRHPERSTMLARRMLEAGVVEAITPRIVAGTSMGACAFACVLCWRWLLLCSPAEAGAYFGQDPAVLAVFVQMIVSTPVSVLQRAATAPHLASLEDTQTALLLVESVVCLGVCYALTTAATRMAMHRLLHRHLSSTTRTQVRQRVESTFGGVGDTYFESLPSVIVVQVEGRTRDGRGSTLDATMEKGENAGSTESSRVIDSPSHWRRLFLSTLRSLLIDASYTDDTSSSPMAHHHSSTVAMPLCAVSAPLSLTHARRERDSHHTRLQKNGPHTPQLTRPGEKPAVPAALTEPYHLCSVVRNTEHLGGSFYQESIQAILLLSHHSVCTSLRCDYFRALPLSERASRSPRVLSSSSTHRLRHTLSSRVPFSLKDPSDSAGRSRRGSRSWEVRELARSEVLLFLARRDALQVELYEATDAVREHLKYLRCLLQMCPIKDVERRCRLNDLYNNTYPTIHEYLSYIAHHMSYSPSIRKLVESFAGGVSSGNVVDVYHAVVQCT